MAESLLQAIVSLRLDPALMTLPFTPAFNVHVPQSGVHGFVNGPEPSNPNSNNFCPFGALIPPRPACATGAIKRQNNPKARTDATNASLTRAIINAVRLRAPLQ